MVYNKKDYMKQYYLEHQEEAKEVARKQRLNNPNYNFEMNEYRKATNYKNEKTPKQRAIRYIRRKTGWRYPLEGNICYFCGKKAEVRHHTTLPYNPDEFIFICKDCHKKIHGGNS